MLLAPQSGFIGTVASAYSLRRHCWDPFACLPLHSSGVSCRTRNDPLGQIFRKTHHTRQSTLRMSGMPNPMRPNSMSLDRWTKVVYEQRQRRRFSTIDVLRGLSLITVLGYVGFLRPWAQVLPPACASGFSHTHPRSPYMPAGGLKERTTVYVLIPLRAALPRVLTVCASRLWRAASHCPVRCHPDSVRVASSHSICGSVCPWRDSQRQHPRWCGWRPRRVGAGLWLRRVCSSPCCATVGW